MAEWRRIQRQYRLSDKMPEADLEETAALMDLLFMANKCNNSRCAKLMGISTRTWKKWNQEPPPEWYWPLVLREAIKHTLSSVIAQRRATGKKYQKSILEALSRIPRSEAFAEEIANMAYDIRGAELHLRTLLAKKGMWWSEIRLAANSGGYTRQTLLKAARALKLVKTQSGFGADKDSYWRLPTEEEGDD